MVRSVLATRLLRRGWSGSAGSGGGGSGGSLSRALARLSAAGAKALEEGGKTEEAALADFHWALLEARDDASPLLFLHDAPLCLSAGATAAKSPTQHRLHFIGALSRDGWLQGGAEVCGRGLDAAAYRGFVERSLLRSPDLPLAPSLVLAAARLPALLPLRRRSQALAEVDGEMAELRLVGRPASAAALCPLALTWAVVEEETRRWGRTAAGKGRLSQEALAAKLSGELHRLDEAGLVEEAWELAEAQRRRDFLRLQHRLGRVRILLWDRHAQRHTLIPRKDV